MQERTDEGKDSKEFWEGTSVNGDELGLLFWQGRLSGRLRTPDKDYKIQRLKGSLFALIEIKRLDTPDCDTPEGGRGEAAAQRGAPGSPLESVGVSKSSSTQQDTRVLVVYTDDALDYFGLLENLTDEIAWAFWYMEQAFNETDAFTRPKQVGTEWISFDEPASWTDSNDIWEDELLPYDDEIFDHRGTYTADIVMLILDSTGACCRGSSRAVLPTDIDDAIFYVEAAVLGSPVSYTTAHEMAHMFGSPGLNHPDGYFIKDAAGDDVFTACFTNHQTQTRATRTIMFKGLGGNHERRARYYSSFGDTFSTWCPDEGGSHTFMLGDSPTTRNTENLRIEMNEETVSMFWENLGSSMAARVRTGGPTVLDEADLPFTVENYPNPFNPQTTLRFTLPEEAHVRLTVYDVLGREIMVLVDGTRLAGTHEAHFDGSRLPSGIYVYRLRVTGEHGAQEATGRLTMLK